jgi:two-component system phosphate regulon sensor histidine kinase PhoR
VKVRAPANIYLHRAQVILLLVAIVPTILTTPVGIILLASGGSHAVAVVAGVLVLAFCASSIVGYVLGSIFLRRSVSLVDTQNQFLSSVSHELRTPMTSMRMFIEALLDDRLTDAAERNRCLTALQNEIVRLDELVGRLIDLSRVESGRRPYELEPLAVEEIVDAATAAFDAIRLHAPVDLTTDVEAGLQVRGDRAALTQVLVNLLSNAWKHGEEPKQIRIGVRAAGEREVLLSVTDNGPGIPAEDRQRMFEMFERGKTTLRKGTSGSGLGLAIVNAIVERHRGRIELEPAPGGGCSFKVFLRRLPGHVAQES